MQILKACFLEKSKKTIIIQFVSAENFTQYAKY